MTLLETEHLLLRQITPEDAAFMLDLLNQPSFIQFVGDRGVRTLDDARKYISTRIAASYEKYGFGLYLTLLKADQTPIGICGLVKRPALRDVDIGFAFLPQYWLQSYAFESASAMLDYARNTLGIKRVVGIVAPDNPGSIRVLEKIGLQFERMIRLSEDDIELKLFG
jgi:RimJ/RimL family protein N-acetyltransferase